MTVRTAPRSYDYGSDLQWVAGSWGTPVIVGNGYAKLFTAREGALALHTVLVVIGSTTSIPSGQWFFEMPADLLAFGGAVPIVAFGHGVAAEVYSPFATGNIFSELYEDAGAPSGVGCQVFAPVFGRVGNPSGALTSADPFSWLPGNFLFFTGVSFAFGN